MHSEKNKSIFWQLGLLVVAAFYLVARLWRLSDSCLTFDEIFSVHAAEHGWSSMFSFVAADLIHPPLFYALLKIWILAGGESLFWLRLFPVVFAALAIAPFLLLCRELKLTTLETLTAFVFLAVNGALIRYSQEVRMYSPLFCFSLVSLWLFVRFINYLPINASTFKELTGFPKNNYIWLFLTNLILIYTHYFGWVVVLSELAIFVYLCRGFSTALIRIQRGKRFGAFFCSVILLGLCFLPWAWVVWQAASQSEGFSQNLGWAAKPGFVSIWRFVLILNEPFYYQQSSIDAPNILILVLPIAFICLTAIVLNGFRHRNEAFILTAFFTIVPVATAFIVSWISPHSVWGTRHLIIVFAPFAILTALAINCLPIKELKIAAFGLIGTLILIAGIRHFSAKPQTFIWCGWRELAAEADVQTNELTTIYIFEDDGAYQLWYALKNNPKFNIISIDGYADMPEDKAFFLPRSFDEVKVADKNAIAGDTFYLAFRETAWKPDKQVLQDLRARGYEIGKPLEFKAQGVTAFLVPIEKSLR
ncbi:MAG: hypothetical protein ABI954_06510 [Pyrinomonadaceae bacterium]